MCTHRGGLSAMMTGGNPTVTASVPASQMSLKQLIAAAQRGEEPTPGADTITTAQRAEAFRDMRNYIGRQRVASDFSESGSPWTQMGSGSWQFDVDDAFPGNPIRTRIGAMVRTTVDARGRLAYEVKTWERGVSQTPWRTVSTAVAADNLARQEMRDRLDSHERRTRRPQDW